MLVGSGLRISHRLVVGGVGRCQVLEECVVGCLADPGLLTIPVVVVGIIGNLGTAWSDWLRVEGRREKVPRRRHGSWRKAPRGVPGSASSWPPSRAGVHGKEFPCWNFLAAMSGSLGSGLPSLRWYGHHRNPYLNHTMEVQPVDLWLGKSQTKGEREAFLKKIVTKLWTEIKTKIFGMKANLFYGCIFAVCCSPTLGCVFSEYCIFLFLASFPCALLARTKYIFGQEIRRWRSLAEDKIEIWCHLYKIPHWPCQSRRGLWLGWGWCRWLIAGQPLCWQEAWWWWWQKTWQAAVRKRQGELMFVFMLSISLFLCLPCMKQVVGKVDEHFPTHRLVAVHVAGETHLATTSFDILSWPSAIISVRILPLASRVFSPVEHCRWYEGQLNAGQEWTCQPGKVKGDNDKWKWKGTILFTPQWVWQSVGISEQAAQIWKQWHRWECTSAVDRNRCNVSDHQPWW